MRRNEALAIILALLATAGTVGAALWYEHHRNETLQVVELLANSPLNGNWTPASLEVTKGKPVRLKIRNRETVAHGFSLPDFNVGITEIKPGQVFVVEFTPDRTGTFPFYCTVWCSDEHLAMTGKVVVSEPALQAVR
jgi:heme/copper-type cytochrome/quinol oxidase subunit 2